MAIGSYRLETVLTCPEAFAAFRASPGPSAYIWLRMGKRNAAVFPEPKRTRPTHQMDIERSVQSLIYCCVCHTSLCAGHQVSFGLDDGNGIFLDRGRPSVTTQRDVTHNNLPHVHVLELQDT